MCVKYNNIHEYINTVNNNCSTKVIHYSNRSNKQKKTSRDNCKHIIVMS